VQIRRPDVYFVVFIETAFASFEDAIQRAPDELARHRRHSAEMHDRGEVLMAGAFVEEAGPLSTMAICRSREDAEAFIAGDPFVQAGLTTRSTIRAWADMFAGRSAGTG
jgi:uncharacterized protein